MTGCPGDGLEVGTRPASCADVQALGDSHGISADCLSAGRKQTAAKRPPNRWPRRHPTGPASCRPTLTLAEAPLFVRLVVVGGGTPQSAVVPPVRGARVVLLIQEEEREVARLPVRCAFNGRQSWKGKEKMGTRAAPLLLGDLTLSISATRTQRHRRVVCDGEHKRASADSARGRREGQST